MIYVDDRIGSRDLENFFKSWGASYQLTHLDFGDACFEGNGPDRDPLQIGIEIKAIGDALNSIQTGRFAGHQLPGLLSKYKPVWLIVEGQYHVDRETGLLMHKVGPESVPLQIGSRKFMYKELDNWLTTMEVKAGLKVRRTLSRLETARVITDLHYWWTAKTWEDHRSHLALAEIPIDGNILLKPNIVRRMAAEIPHIGWAKSKEIARKFRTVLDMAAASVKEWQEIDGIGKKIAEDTVKLLQDGE